MCRERRECNIGKKMRDREKTREEEKRRWLGRAATRRWPVEPIPPSSMFTSLTLEHSQPFSCPFFKENSGGDPHGIKTF